MRCGSGVGVVHLLVPVFLSVMSPVDRFPRSDAPVFAAGEDRGVLCLGRWWLASVGTRGGIVGCSIEHRGAARGIVEQEWKWKLNRTYIVRGEHVPHNLVAVSAGQVERRSIGGLGVFPWLLVYV